MSEETKDNALNEAVEQIEKAVGKVDESTKSVIEVEKSLSELQTSNAQVVKDVVEMRAYLEAEHGKSGAQDFEHEMSKFISKAFKHNKTNKTSAGFNEKAVADYTTTTDATAGYLVDDILAKEIFGIGDAYGNILPRTTQITVPAGTTLKVNKDLLLPIATWRATGQGVAMDEDESTFAQATLTPALLGSYVKIANELLDSPDIGFGGIMSARMARSILLAKETAILAGDLENAEPTDGLLNGGLATNDQTAITTLGFDDVAAFLGECIVDYAPSGNPAENQILMTQGEYLGLIASGAILTTPGFSFSDPANEQPARIYGYEIVTHPQMSGFIALGNLKDILVANSGQMSVDFNPYATTGWTANETWMRVFTHCDYEIMQPNQWSKATIDA